jgi:hypothetical protein
VRRSVICYRIAMLTETIETRAHTTRDGVLNLSVNVGMFDADVDVILQVRPLAGTGDVDANGWPKHSLRIRRCQCVESGEHNETLAWFGSQSQGLASQEASTYDETLPYKPPTIDRKRKATYLGHIRLLAPKARAQSRCGAPSRLRLNTRPRRCT